MDLIIYSTVSEEHQKRIDDLVNTFLPQGEIEVFRSLDDLSQKLKQPAQAESVAVLAPGSREDLLQILSRHYLLRDLRIVLIAPDHDVETVAIAHKLRPRYLTYLNGDFGDLAAVLLKMISGSRSGEAPSPSPSGK